MDRVTLLEALKKFTDNCLKDLIMPTRVQSVDEEQQYRPPDVYMMRLPDSKSAMKKAPYIIHSVITAADKQEPGNYPALTTTVRSIFCAYSPDEQEGALLLLNMMERLRISLEKICLIGDKNEFKLLMQDGIEFMIYPDDTAPYYSGEMITVWDMPPVRREVPQIW